MGQIVEVGDEVEGFKVGDKVICPFTVSWCELSLLLFQGWLFFMADKKG